MEAGLLAEKRQVVFSGIEDGSAFVIRIVAADFDDKGSRRKHYRDQLTFTALSRIRFADQLPAQIKQKKIQVVGLRITRRLDEIQSN